jgi:sec-independent protein translocase protein TatC
MALWEHLDDLRGAMIRSLLALFAGVIVTYNFSERIVHYLEEPLLRILPPGNRSLYYTGITDKFFIYLKVAVIAAAILMSPYLFYEIWKFASPGLYRRERRFLLPFVGFGSGAFIAGICFAFYLVIPTGYKFLIQFGSPNERAIITLTEYFSLTLKLMLALGLIFELPVIFVLLAKFGLVTAKQLSGYRRHAFVASAVVSAVATPTPDAFTMILVMAPLYLLCEVSIIAVRWVTVPADEGAAE